MSPLLRALLVVLTAAATCAAQDRSARTSFHLFFGHGGHVTLAAPPLPQPGDGLTVECWFKTEVRPKRAVALVEVWPEQSKDTDGGLFSLQLQPNRQLTFTLRGAGGETGSVAATGKWLDGGWHRVTVTWDGATLAAYVDGEPRAQKACADLGELATTAHPLVVGPRPGNSKRRPPRLHGCVGGVQLWRRGQDAAEVAAAFPVKPGDDGLLWHHPLRSAQPAAELEDFDDDTPNPTLSPVLARAGWVRTRPWPGAAPARPADAPPEAPSDVYCYDLADVVDARGRHVLVQDAARGRVGVLWQGRDSDAVHVTWVDADLRTETTRELAAAEGAQLAGGTSDDEGNLYYLTVQRSPADRAEGFEVEAVLHRARHDGSEQVAQPLDVSQQGLNIYRFHDGPLRSASVRFHKGLLGVILPRQMHMSGDGLRHQGAIALTYRAKELSLVRNHGQTSGHSMANYLTVNQRGQFVGVDLGDNYPRGVHLHVFDRASRTSRLVYTFKTAHARSARNGSPVYDEISGDGKTFYKWSNDNAVYTELGGVHESARGYTVVFATDRGADGRVLDNSRAFGGCPDARDLALVHVVKDLGRAPGGSEVSNKLMASLPRKPQVETGGYFDFGGGWRKQRVVGVTWLTDYAEREAVHAPQLVPLPDGDLMILWERQGVPGGVRGMVVEPDGEVVTPEFALPFMTAFNRQDRVLTTETRSYLLAGDLGGYALRLYYLEHER